MNTTQYDHLNTPENRERFEALYIGQPVKCWVFGDKVIRAKKLSDGHKTRGIPTSSYLELTPLSEIANDHLNKLVLSKNYTLEDQMYYIPSLREWVTYEAWQIDTIRSLGYVFSFMGIPTEIMQAWGWWTPKPRTEKP